MKTGRRDARLKPERRRVFRRVRPDRKQHSQQGWGVSARPEQQPCCPGGKNAKTDDST
jgi:hypothetical protein